jgi:hypothetical protein
MCREACVRGPIKGRTVALFSSAGLGGRSGVGSLDSNFHSITCKLGKMIELNKTQCLIFTFIILYLLFTYGNCFGGVGFCCCFALFLVLGV